MISKLHEILKVSGELSEKEKVHETLALEYLDKCVLFAYRGSKAHNMYVPNSEPDSIDDIDYMGIYIADREQYLGIQKPEIIRSKTYFYGTNDIELHELRRFMTLLLKANPNLMGMLWLKSHLYLKKTKWGQLLIDNRDIFASKKIYHSFTGYAHAQLHKMTHLAFKGYMGQKRKQLVTKYGYDTKNAAHCLRLLQMGIEFLLTGELEVWREDADKYLAIKRGQWTLEQVKKEAERLFLKAEEALFKSQLPYSPDKERANELCIEIMENNL